MQTIAKSLVALAAVTIAWFAGDTPRAGKPAAGEPKPAHESRAPASNGQFRGMAIQLHGGLGIYDKYAKLIPEVAALGADTVLFVVHGWQEHAGSLDIHIDAKQTANAEDLGRLCDLAGENGLRVVLMPIVLLKNPRNNEWRGKIVPENKDWDAWFKRYTQFIVHFAKLAEQHHVTLLMIGSELVKTEAYTKRWQDVIAEVRQNFRGKLGYSANWDHYQTDKIGFWQELDYVGMTTYYKLADRENPDMDEVLGNWSRYKSDILTFQRQVSKPIIFTEAGWCSQEGAAKEAWNYYHNQKATEAGLREQALCYEAFIKTWAEEAAVGGIIWWEWDPSEGGKTDYNYTPRGKPAERILRDWFARKPSPPAADEEKAEATATGKTSASR